MLRTGGYFLRPSLPYSLPKAVLYLRVAPQSPHNSFVHSLDLRMCTHAVAASALCNSCGCCVSAGRTPCCGLGSGAHLTNASIGSPQMCFRCC
eukprot:6177647-Pleurochrysis_carterae.AAC.1